MLGYKEYTAPLGVEESKEIRNTARRVAKGNPNAQEKKMLEHYAQLRLRSRNKYIWK
ncbi:MAG: hypothetical protein HDS97_05480 [Bacteroidales bacterium]|nr:hypothetical protein [Bacteroidales bacterium]